MRGLDRNIIENRTVLGCSEEAPGLAKGGRGAVTISAGTHAANGLSSRKALATLGAAATQDQATAFGGHPRAKPVCTLALEDAGLKCSFHGTNPVVGNK